MKLEKKIAKQASTFLEKVLVGLGVFTIIIVVLGINALLVFVTYTMYVEQSNEIEFVIGKLLVTLFSISVILFSLYGLFEWISEEDD